MSLNSTAATPYLFGFLFGSVVMFFLLAIVPHFTSSSSLGSMSVSRVGYASDAPNVVPSPLPTGPLYVPCSEDVGESEEGNDDPMPKAGADGSGKGRGGEKDSSSHYDDDDAIGPASASTRPERRNRPSETAPAAGFSGEKLWNVPKNVQKYVGGKGKGKHPVSVPPPWGTPPLACTHWAVVGGGHGSTAATQDLIAHEDWCVVVVTEIGAPAYPLPEGPRLVVVSPPTSAEFEAPNMTARPASAAYAALSKAFPDLFALLRWDHVSRKNAGYLFAISQGATHIWDVEDGAARLPATSTLLPPPSLAPITVAPLDGTPSEACLVLNALPRLGGTIPVWARGLPAGPAGTSPQTAFESRCRVDVAGETAAPPSVALWHSLTEGKADVDAVCALTYGASGGAVSTAPLAGLSLPRGVLAPISAKATLVDSRAFFTLILPATVECHVADIWRGYVAQRLLWDVGLTSAVLRPRVGQSGSGPVPSAVGSLGQEADLYGKGAALVAFLAHSWSSDSPTAAGKLLNLTLVLVERGYLGASDALLAYEWLRALVKVGHVPPLPPVPSPSPSPSPSSSPSPSPWPPRTSIPNIDPNCASKPPATFWTSDLHDGTRADVMSTVSGIGHRIYNGGHKRANGPYPQVWSMPGVIFPARYAPLIDSHWGQFYIHEQEVRSTFEFYKNDPDIAATDAFVCMFPNSYCELWLPLNRSIIWLAAHRYSLARCPREQWDRLTQHMQITAAHPNRGHVVAAMSVYDAEYINYFTGLKPLVVTSTSLWYAGHGATTYTKARNEILIGPLQVNSFPRLSEINSAGGGRYNFVPVKALYAHFQSQDIANHRAVVMFPYAVMSYGITEVYAMGIPMFVPTIPFLRALDMTHDRRNRDDPYCGRDAGVPPKHPSSAHPFSPEDDDEASFTYWLQFADLYQWPHIQTFDSLPDLIAKLDKSDFDVIHTKMMEENERREARVSAQWKQIACNIPRGNLVPQDYNVAVHELLHGATSTQVN
jgi:hypothetical protein